MESYTLNNKFNSIEVINPEEKLNSLLELGIDPKFAEKLNAMFEEIGAKVGEIKNIVPAISSANDILKYKLTGLDTKKNLELMKLTMGAANDDLELKIAA